MPATRKKMLLQLKDSLLITILVLNVFVACTDQTQQLGMFPIRSGYSSVHSNDIIPLLFDQAQEDFFIAVKSENLMEVRRLLLSSNSINIKCRTEYDDTALILAARLGNFELVRVLLQNSANVDDKGRRGDTALMWAATHGHAEMVNTLLSNGAKVNLQDKFRNAALIWGAYKGHAKIVDILLRKGACIDQRGEYGNTALLFAAIQGHAEVVRILLTNGANVDEKNNIGDTALNLARWHGDDSEIVQLLSNKIDIKKYLESRDRKALTINSEDQSTSLAWEQLTPYIVGHSQEVRLWDKKEGQTSHKNISKRGITSQIKPSIIKKRRESLDQ